jgi:RimJ/RimL family protein N-acetyltransferase
MSDPFRSKRLLYRLPEAGNSDFFLATQTDAIAFRNSNTHLQRPQSTAGAQEYQKAVEEALLGVVICLPAPDTSSQPVPIGVVHLSPLRPQLVHHRFATIGIMILQPYQGQGYGSEAINWILDWAFETAGLHRVGIEVFEYNVGARKLYEKLGFKKEGVIREKWWHAGRFWDDIQMGMLDRDWKELRSNAMKTS